MTPTSQASRSAVELLAILCILGVVFLIAFTPNLGRTLFSVDTVVPTVRNLQHLHNYQSSWRADTMGRPSTFSPFNLYLYLLALVFPIGIWQRVVLFLPVLIASLSMYFFLKETNLGRSSWGRILGAGFYGINWATLGGNWVTIDSIAGSVGMLQAYAWLPLFLLGLYKTLSTDSPRLVSAIGTALALALASLALGIQVAVHQILVSLPIVIHAVAFHPRRVVKNIPWLILSALAYVLLSLDVYVGHLGSILTLDAGAITSRVHGPSVKLFVETLEYQRAYPLSMSPLSFIASDPAAQFDFLSLVALSLMILPLLCRQSYRRRALYLCSSLCTVSVLGFIMLCRENEVVSNMLFEGVFFLQAFMEPIKWYFPLAPWAVVMLVTGIECIVGKAPRLNRRVTLGFAIGLLMFSSLAWRGHTLKARAAFQQDALRTAVYARQPVLSPTEIDEMIQYFDSLIDGTDSFRVLILPYGKYLATMFSATNSILRIMPVRDRFLMELLDATVTEMRSAQESQTFSSVMRLLGARYVVVTRYSEGPIMSGPPRLAYAKGKAYWICGQPDYFERFMNSQSEWEVLRETSGYVVYQFRE